MVKLKIMTVLHLVVLGLFSLIIISCRTDVDEPEIKECPDIRFIGKWERFDNGARRRYEMYYFLDSNRLRIAYIDILNENMGYLAENREWKKEEDAFYIRKWDINATWELFNIQYVDDNHIIINGKTYTTTTRSPPW